MSFSKNNEWPSTGDSPLLSVPPKSSPFLVYASIYLSIIIIFNVEIRSIGYASIVPDIKIFPDFWLTDIGFILPLIVLKISNLKIISRPIPIAIAFISSYGLLIAVLRNNSVQSMGYDIWTLVAFFSGYAVILVIKKTSDVLKVVVNIEIFLTFAATAIIIFLPEAGILSSLGGRLTHPASFILLETPIILISTILIFTFYYRNKSLNIKAWLCGLILLVDATIIMQTRSMFITVGIGILLAIVSSYAIRRSDLHYKGNNFIYVSILFICIALVLNLVIRRKATSIDSFVSRVKSGISYYNDPSISIRFAEVTTVLSKMKIEDHLIGMGLNPASELVDNQSFEYNNMHIGIFNIWWRFGIITFIIVNILILRKGLNWLIAVFVVNKRVNQRIERVVILISAPSLIIAYIISLTSGGWSASFSFGLGIALGIYSRLIKSVSLDTAKQLIKRNKSRDAT
jgi:hypothetical protein